MGRFSLKPEARPRVPEQRALTLVEEAEDTLEQLRELFTKINSSVGQIEKMSERLMFMVVASEIKGISPDTYNHIGGEDGVKRAVTSLYNHVMADPELEPYFRRSDMHRIQRRQVEMFLAVFGIRDYKGVKLSVIHHGLNVTSSHFDKLIGYVKSALLEVGLDSKDTDQTITRLVALKPEIVGGAA